MPLAMFGGCRDAFVLVHALVLALVLGDPRGAFSAPVRFLTSSCLRGHDSEPAKNR